MRKPELEKQMYDHLDYWKQSGLSQKAYCAQHGLILYQFVYWAGKRRKSQLTHSDFNSLSMPEAKCDIHLRLLNEVEINLPSSTPVAYIKSLIPY